MDERKPRPFLRVHDLHKTFYHAGEEIQVLRGVDWWVQAGETVALMGPSGSGKTTMLHLLAGLEAPDRGQIWIADAPIHALDEHQLSAWRNRNLGVVYQQHLLMEELTALENVALRCLIAGYPRDRALEQAAVWLERVGLGDRMHHYPTQLSGGEAQRVAIARALVVEPPVIFADEPTGNLDESTGEQVFQRMLDLVRMGSATLIVATHNRSLARRCGRVWFLHHGHLTLLEEI